MGIRNRKGGRNVDDLINSFQTEDEMLGETKYTIETLGKYGLHLKLRDGAVGWEVLTSCAYHFKRLSDQVFGL